MLSSVIPLYNGGGGKVKGALMFDFCSDFTEVESIDACENVEKPVEKVWGFDKSGKMWGI